METARGKRDKSLHKVAHCESECRNLRNLLSLVLEKAGLCSDSISTH